MTPATANVLTCDTLQFKETGGAGNGSWSVAPAGSIDATSGLFTGPLTTPAAPATTITYAETTASTTATVQLATAFLGAVATLPDSSNPDGIGTSSPFEHTFTANGSRVYTAVQNKGAGSTGAFLEADLYVSNDSGATFTAGAVYHTGNLSPGCVTAAVDAGNPDIVYLLYMAAHGDADAGTTVRLAVSKDGAKTFPTEYIIADTNDGLGTFGCPDVISPSADHVIVSGDIGNASSNSAWAGTFASGGDGATIGPVGTEGVAGPANPAMSTADYAASDTNSGSAKMGCSFDGNGGGRGPRLATNGAGTVCVTYTGQADACKGYFVQCSTDSGSTWTAPLSIATPTTNSNLYSAVSKSGNVALVWLASVAGQDEVMLAISKDGGKTFGTPVQYPSAVRKGPGGSGAYTGAPVVTWQTDNVLWLSQTLNGSDSPIILVDKTCDFGTSWSGAVNAGNFEGTTLLWTTNGMVATGWMSGHGSAVTIPLAQDAQ